MHILQEKRGLNMKLLTNENFVDKAKEAVDSLRNEKDDRGRAINIVSTSQIRNLLAMTADIYNEVMLLREEILDERIKGRIAYLRVRCLYESGRDRNEPVKVFVKNSKLLDILPTIETKKDYILFSHYMEALVAWRKYSYSRDN